MIPHSRQRAPQQVFGAVIAKAELTFVLVDLFHNDLLQENFTFYCLTLIGNSEHLPQELTQFVLSDLTGIVPRGPGGHCRCDHRGEVLFTDTQVRKRLADLQIPD